MWLLLFDRSPRANGDRSVQDSQYRRHTLAQRGHERSVAINKVIEGD
jgi:hypothetical protein